MLSAILVQKSFPRLCHSLNCEDDFSPFGETDYKDLHSEKFDLSTLFMSKERR